MSRYLFIALLSAVSLFGSFPALAELPSLMPDRPEHARPAGAAPRDSLAPAFGGFALLRRGRLHTSFGAVDYRFGGESVSASFQYQGAAASAVIGYDGERRLEIDWRSGGRNLKLAIAATEDDGYRIEIARDF